MNSPQQPSPAQTAAAQMGVNNQQAALTQAYGMPNQVGPYGTQTSTQTGTRTVPAVTKVNKKGKTVVVTPAYDVPVYTQTTTLDPAQQHLLDQQNQAGAAGNDLAIAQIDRLKGVLSQPLDLSNDAVSGYITDLYRKRLDPIWNERATQLDTSLRNKGLQPGTAGYDAAMRDFNAGRNDAYDTVLRNARAQSVQEMVLGRQEPINEAASLRTGGQVNLPQFANIGGPQVQGVDYAGLQANNYNQQMAQNNAFLGGLAGLGGAGLQAAGMAYGGWKPTTGTP